MAARVPDGVARRPGLARRLRRRIPVRIRHHWKLLAVCVAFVVVLTVVFGSARVRPYVTSGSDRGGGGVTVDLAGDRDLFDAGVAHTISLTFRDADYERMLDGFFDDGEKEYVEADLTIDGVMVPSVGIRLKGNSTLSGLTRDGQTRQRTGAGGAPDGAERGGGPGRAGLAAEEPETLPWLISFDEFVEGRRYQGHQEIAVRVGGMGGGSTVLNEALALSLLDTSGERTQRYAYSSFTVNDRPTTARLIVEHPDENYAEQMDATGVLYKSRSTSQFTDQGDDPIDYQDDFNQINLTGSQDLQPVIDLIKWVNGASDEEFDAQLAERVDVEQFARYVAMQNLLLNFDDMAGPGRNYYLWYDLETRKFSVISWDHNLTFSGSADHGPHDAGRMGGPGGMRTAPDGENQQGTPPEGFQPPEGFELPEGAEPPAGLQRSRPPEGDQPGGGDRQGGMRAGHILKERFLASEAFTDVYENAYRELYQELYGSGRALAALDEITAVLATVDGYDAVAVTADAEQLRTLVQQRTESLRDDEVITGA
ncbi:CotH kinase family protein [Solwaraspora sp. WMMD1047]|uniref:CotH kinase family protein n=1 Tax=Solwaraspora sp. WMMD1047 TaxID=3016102 RepID=UPI0024172F8C|nr:CotH kinase family protein [Solwaraspora sp. WMMD1047]MDG4832821.1 CotH kinase family protein [Solwaraspora sp. WMMD1047]